MIDIGVIVMLTVVFLVTLAFVKSRRPSGMPPGPSSLPGIGNLHVLFGNTTFHLTLYNLYQQYGPIFSFQFAFYPAIVLSDFDTIKEALLDQQDVFSDRPVWMPAFKIPMKGKGVIFKNGTEWKELKKLTLTSMRELGFGKKTLELKVIEEAHHLIAELERVKNTEYSFRFLFNTAAANVICGVLFGERYEHSDTEFLDLITKLNLNMSSGGFQNPMLFLPRSFMLLVPVLKPSFLKILKNDKEFADIIQKRLNEHRESFDDSNPRDFIDLFLASKQDDAEIVQTVKELFIAGSETTSTTLLWAFIYLIKIPSVQDKCRQEIHQVVGVELYPTMADKENLPYVSATIMEIQRLSNVAALSVFHNAKSSTVLRGYTIPKDTIVITNLYAVHMDPKLFPDPERFNPDRFLDRNGKVMHNVDGFMPFGTGKRSCLGENLAKMELFLFLTSMLQKYRFIADDPDALPGSRDAKLGFTLLPNEYKLKIVDI